MMNNNFFTYRFFQKIIKYLCGMLFVYAAVSKWLDFETFQLQLGQSPVISSYAAILVWLVPFLEILTALALFMQQDKKLGLYMFLFLMSAFTSYIVIILKFADFTPCSCGGILATMTWTEHLLFNLLMMLLAITALYFPKQKPFPFLSKIGSCLFFGIIISWGLFWGSTQQLQRNNAFIRKYLPHPTEKLGEYSLKVNSYYLAGIDSSSIYLGNYTVPLRITQFNRTLTQQKTWNIALDSTHLPFRRIRIKIAPPYLFLADGTVPVMFRGKLPDTTVSIFSYKEAYFSSWAIADSTTVGIKTFSSRTKHEVLGVLKKEAIHSTQIRLKDSIFKHTPFTPFTNDGMLLYNRQQQLFLYPYYYKNKYKIMNKKMDKLSSGSTIDTVGTPILNIAHYTKFHKYKRGGNSVIVNRLSATNNKYLYINSNRLGKYDEKEVLRSASIIDVYQLSDKSYQFSFYLYHQPDEGLSDFKIYNNILVALVNDTLWVYRLKISYFK